MPALGPSFGIAPSGKWMWKSTLLVEVGLEAEGQAARAHVRDRRLGRLLHDLAELAGQRELALAAADRDLGRQQVAAAIVTARPLARPISSAPVAAVA
jgi:hypothetical protein